METKEQEVKTLEVKEKKPQAPRKKKTEATEAKPRAKRAPRKKKTEETPTIINATIADEQPAVDVTAVVTPKQEKPVLPEPNDEELKAEEATMQTTEKEEAKTEMLTKQVQQVVEPKKEEPKKEEPKAEAPKKEEPKKEEPKKTVSVPPCPTLLIRNIVELINAPKQQLLLNDQQIQQLTLEEAEKRFRWIEGTLALVLNYDIVISDTNIWIELLTGHTSNHSDPRYNARLQFERQLEFISRLTQHRGGRFMMMSETYEEIDRFATMQDPVSHKEADMTDEATCRNIAGRLAKRLILSQQRENRLRIEGITSESHHSAFADPAIIRRTVELFAQGKKVLLLTNDASVAIRAMGMCDDLQRTNDIDDDSWDEIYAPLRPMVMTFDDLKLLDAYTRQYHFLQMAAGKSWMEDVPQRMERRTIVPLFLWNEGFRPGDRYSEKKMQQLQQKQDLKQKPQQSKQKQEQPKQKQEQPPKPQPKQEQPKQEQPKPQPKQEQPKQPEQIKKDVHKPEEAKAAVLNVEPTKAELQPAEAPQAEASVAEEPVKEKKPSRRGGRRSPRKKPAATAN